MSYTVGQKLLCGSLRSDAPQFLEVTISRVGRRWLYLDTGRVAGTFKDEWRAAIGTLTVDREYRGALWNVPYGYACFSSVETYEAERAANKAADDRRVAWKEIQAAVNATCGVVPPGLDAAAIRTAMAMLGLPLDASIVSAAFSSPREE